MPLTVPVHYPEFHKCLPRFAYSLPSYIRGEMINTVSVVIPVYNAEPFVEAAVRSALEQPEVLEVILVDDAGPDNSLAVCQRLAATEPKVSLFRHPDHANHGAAASRNLGFTKTTGTYVVFLDADDIFLPDRFAAERRIFAEHPDADGVYGGLGVLFHSEAARLHFEKLYKLQLTTVGWAAPPELLARAMLDTGKGFGYFHLNALTVKREALERLPVLFPLDVVLHEDTDMIIRLAYHARLYPGIIDRPVALRGVHAANRITHNDRESYTRSTLYTSLLRWANAVGLDEDLRRKVEAEQMRCAILLAKGPAQVLAIGRRFVGRAWLLNVMDVRQTYFDALLGKDSKASQLMQKISWRLLNGLFIRKTTHTTAS
jgi:glycosyltransferase involved in cell wall biosynthesis